MTQGRWGEPLGTGIAAVAAAGLAAGDWNDRRPSVPHSTDAEPPWLGTQVIANSHLWSLQYNSFCVGSN
jgi:hypothetical protein